MNVLRGNPLRPLLFAIAGVCSIACLADACSGADPEEHYVAPPSDELKAALNLDPFYAKHVSVGGFPVLGSAHVSDYALLEAAFLLDRMLQHRPEIRDAMIRNKVRLVVMAYDERTTDVPEHSDLRPRERWDRRARGLGATRQRPAVSCGEENLLCYPGDPYSTENILIHEFAHAIHQMGLNSTDKNFQAHLEAAFAAATEEGLWRGTYAASNVNEYWAEGVQSFFDTNRSNDSEHNHVDTREELQQYDLRLATLCTEVFGKDAWRYAKPGQRTEQTEPTHLKGYEFESAPRFEWKHKRSHPTTPRNQK